jgi:hypothetical protein
MKATLIFSIVILLAAIAGCSDNMNVTDPLNATHNVQKQPNHTQDQGKGELVWSLRELKVWTVSGDVVENKATYIKTSPVPPMEPHLLMRTGLKTVMLH